jgi:uncharacterized protein (TIGR01244 family)
MRVNPAAAKRLLILCAAALASLGHAQLPNRAEVLPGVVTAGQPDEAALRDLAKDGFVAVIDLRGADEDRGLDDERKAVEALGMNYISLPVVGADAINYENAAALDELLGRMPGPVLVHCSSGNRAGALLALRQRLNGVSAEEAFAIGVAAGMSSPAMREAAKARLDER